MATTYTIEMLQALEKSIATGSRQVMYGDKMIVYRDLSEMIKIRDIMRDELGLNKNRKVVLTQHNKGL